jgi:hypothetical protein
MIIEMSFALVGGINFGLERKYDIIENLIKRYPHATWKRIINLKKGVGKYIVRID